MAKLRGAVFNIYLGVITSMLGLFGAPLLIAGERPARAVMRLWAVAVIAGLAAICGLRHRVEGAEHIPGGAAIVAANHQSMWETIALLTVLPNASIVFKQELLDVPVYGFWARRTGHIVVDRDAGAKAIRKLKKDAAARLEAGGQVVIFPEGTRARPGELGQLQPGVAAIYSLNLAPCSPAVHDSGAYWRHPGPEKRPGAITLRFLPEISAGLTRKVFMTSLADALAAARRLPESPA